MSDSGTGIDPQVIDKVFDPFFTTKAQGEGTGLGLSTVYGIVKQSGGYIYVQNQTRGGAQVHDPLAARLCRPMPEETQPLPAPEPEGTI